MQIQAAVAHGNHAPLVMEPIELDEPQANEIRVRIVATGLCHTDITVMDHAPLPWPAVLGHEGAGIVEKIGSGVSDLEIGDHVILTTSSCGTCENCLRGSPSFCFNFLTQNMSGGYRADGSCTHHQHGKPVFGRFLGQSAFAAYVLVNERNVIKIDKDLPLDLMAPLGCGIQTGAAAVLNILKPRPGSSIAIFGSGAVGLSALMAAKIAGCGTIIAIDTQPTRLEIARSLGATMTINAKDEDAVAEIQKGGGVNYAVEAAGNAAVMGQAVASLGYNGEAVLVGVAMGQTVSFDPNLLQSRGLTIKGTLMAGRDGLPAFFINQLIAFWRQGRLPIERLISFYDFADINTAIEHARSGSAIKPVLRVSAI